MKKYILNWLGIEMIERRIANQTLRIQELQQENSELKRRFNLSVDIRDTKRENGRSWAVVSIRGKKDFVKFYDLGTHNMDHLMNMLRQFDKSNVAIDAPPSYLIKDNLFNARNY